MKANVKRETKNKILGKVILSKSTFTLIMSIQCNLLGAFCITDMKRQ